MTEWIMVIINTIYVVATILICVFNHQSAKAAREQIKEMKCQYDEEKRWRMLPFIQVKKIDEAKFVNGDDFCFLDACEASEEIVSKRILFEITNEGHDIAKYIHYEWDKRKESKIYINSLPVNDKRIFEVLFHAYVKENYNTREVLYIYFEDMMGNLYKEKVYMYFKIMKEDIEFINVSVEAPLYTVQEK